MSQADKIKHKSEELSELMDKLSATKIEPKPMSENEAIQLREVIKSMNKYAKSGNMVALKKYLIHTRNELRNSNR